MTEHEKRITELEDTLKERDRRIADLKRERDDAYKLVADQAEHVEDAKALVDSWIEAFDMALNDKGEWCWGDTLMTRFEALWDTYDNLRRKWNAIVGDYNAIVAPRRRNFGRPLAASPAQQADVRKRLKARQSLRSIAEDTGLGLRTVRTIAEKADGTDRATLARLQRITPDRIAEADERVRRKARAALPGRINAALKNGAELRKRAKGLG